MHKTIASSAQVQIIGKSSGLALSDDDAGVLIAALQFASNVLDMDNLDAVNIIQASINVLGDM